MTKIFINRRLFNSKGERLSVYGKIIDLWKMEITVIRCNKEDMFEKKIADQLYQDGKGLKYVIDLPSLEHPGKQFNIYCRDNFYLVPNEFEQFAVILDLSHLGISIKDIFRSKKDRKIIIKY